MSPVLELEIQRNPLAIRREYGEQVLEQAAAIVVVDEQVEQRSMRFVQLGVKVMDALHLAAAETAQADYFSTCDDRFLRRAKAIPGLYSRVLAVR